jgi:hypothetical protein
MNTLVARSLNSTDWLGINQDGDRLFPDQTGQIA